MYRGKMTRVDMAQFIVMVLYNLNTLPRPTDGRVTKIAKRSLAQVTRAYELAQRALASKPKPQEKP
jgi:hypothetical protein